jgi:fructose-1,6-bisphosphatase I
LEKGVDLRRHVREQEKNHPEASGELTQLLEEISLSAKIVSRAVNRAGLVDILGTAGEVNVYGEEKAKLDVYANKIFKRNLGDNPAVCMIGSEEDEELLNVDEPDDGGKYVLTLDPLDGSSNIDYNVSIGTIFGIFRRETERSESPRTEGDFLQSGRNLVAAGYVIYGSSTMLVYTTGDDVFGFTLDRSIGEFVLCHPSIEVPESGGAYSVNESYYPKWEEPIQKSVDEFRSDSSYTSRYIGSLVADFHRNLLDGGVFLYPNEPETPGKENGKLRLIFEAFPLAYIVRNAGGRASDGQRSILDIDPDEIHQRVPLYLGSREPVETIENHVANRTSQPTP